MFLDIETTGLNLTTDCICEIALLREYKGEIKGVFTNMVNPQRPIPPEVIKIHGITDEMVKSAYTFKDIAKEVREFTESDCSS